MRSWQSLSQRDRRAVILGGVLLGVLLGWYYALSPMLTQWEQARRRIDNAQSRQASLINEAMQRRTQQRRLTTAFGVGAAKPAPPLIPTRARLVKLVQGLAESADLEVQDVRAQPLRPIQDFAGRATIGLTMETTGKPKALSRFLGQLRGSETLLMVDRLSVSGEGGRGEDLDLSLTLSTLVRMAREQQEAGQ